MNQMFYLLNALTFILMFDVDITFIIGTTNYFLKKKLVKYLFITLMPVYEL